MKLIFERSVKGRYTSQLAECDVPVCEISDELMRKSDLPLPEVSENEVSRHYTHLSRRVYGVNSGIYPLGSCTMKYNPRINEEIASLPGFTGIHPLQMKETTEGCREVLELSEKLLCEITGMDAMTFQPAAGAHGELCGLLLIKAYHAANGDTGRTKIIVPDSAHGTNPASATMAGFTVVSVKSLEDGCVDLEALRKAVGPDTAGLMLTNPNTVGLFDKNILEITDIIHEAGGLVYYDGANLNAIMGKARPGDMGFDVVHLNLHKTFSTPHGGGGPGAGPVGCKDILKPFLPYSLLGEGSNEQSIGQLKSFYGNFLVVVKALSYVLTLGAEGIREASENAVLNANYLASRIKHIYPMAYEGFCMHEFVVTLEKLKKETGVSALDIAKGMLDKGIHAPTMYFPLIVHEALMFEPTETESRETLDELADTLNMLYRQAEIESAYLHQTPMTRKVRRLDEVGAARNPRLRYREPAND